eukprot:gnl/MRDRNA2_/MRDRNA2_81387_c0_seq2.p1 gnl/MRDRNA2_/MRDRNA2_81387_c0~~gnl/MRDRNA2_/MRDRNA2_81387_c0_seq2.p1  ORF type:complete len:932 (+),score=160.01 gnl/MRDRNA2_/MRDRNA2_81387_c0_seq2:129-2924(+)
MESSYEEEKLRILELFKRWDKNSDGRLDREELRALLFKLGVASETDANSMMEAADKNKDGFISIEEFINWALPGPNANGEEEKGKNVGGNNPGIEEFYGVDIYSRLEIEKTQIGEGGYGKVFVARDKETDRIHVVKRVIKTNNQVTNSRFYQEIRIMKSLDHPNIVKLRATFEEGNIIYFVMEYLQGGELFDRILDMGSLSERFSAEVLEQVAHALSYAHAHGIAHRDVKPENVVFLSKDFSNSHVKLIDWGFGIYFKECSMRDIVGSTLYMAPEVYQSTSLRSYPGYTEACDLWSLGVLTYVMLSGKQPFWGSNEQMQKRARQERYPIKVKPFDDVSKECMDFLQCLLKANPKQRPNISQVLEHPWFILAKGDSSMMDSSLGGVLNNLKQLRASNRFSQLCIIAVAQHMDHKGSSVLHDVHDVFCTMDLNGDGVLTLDEVVKGFRNVLGADSPTYNEIIEAYKAMDVDQSGTIDYTEFCAHAMGRIALEKDDVLVEAFNAFDLDKSGSLCITELKIVLESVNLKKAWGTDVCQVVADTVLSTHDINGDGMLDFQEFRSLMTSAWGNVEEKGGHQHGIGTHCQKRARQMDNDAEELEVLRHQAMTKIVDPDIVNQITVQQNTILQLLQQGNMREAQSCRKLCVTIASNEHDRLIQEIIPRVLETKYKKVSTRWWYLACTIVTFDPSQRQPVPAGMTDNQKYVNWLCTRAAQLQPVFCRFCEAVCSIFNTSAIGDICSFFGLESCEYFLPLACAALQFTNDSNIIVRHRVGPHKSEDRALAKSQEKWLQKPEFEDPKAQYAVTDCLRVTFEFEDPYVAALFVHALLSYFGKEKGITRLVNRYVDGKHHQPPNINMNIKFGGILAEVQILLCDILIIKRTLHKYYELIRAKEIEQMKVPVFKPHDESGENQYTSESLVNAKRFLQELRQSGVT